MNSRYYQPRGNPRLPRSKLNQRGPLGSSKHYRGVSWHKKDKRWRVMIRHKSHDFYLGAYVDKEVAARVYDVAARHLKGPEAKPNFRDKRPPKGIAPVTVVQRILDQQAAMAMVENVSEE